MCLYLCYWIFFFGNAVFIFCMEGSLIMHIRVELEGIKIWGEGENIFNFIFFKWK